MNWFRLEFFTCCRRTIGTTVARAGFVFVAVLVTSGVSVPFALARPRPRPSAVSCSQIKSQPDVWVESQATALVRAARAAFDNETAQPAYERVLDAIDAKMKQCRLAQDADFAGRYPEFVGYVTTLAIGRLSDHELGFTVPDKQYFAETRPYVEIPDFLLTPGFLRVVSRFETLKQAKGMLRQINESRSASEQLLFFSYQSRHLGTPDNPESFWRLLIVVPGNSAQRVPEKWVQFGVPDPRARAPIRNVSVVSALADAGGTVNVYFKDYFRTYRRDGSITIKGRWELGYGDDNCVSCHKSGILPIFPDAGTVSHDELPIVEKVNQRFLDYVPARFGKYLDVSKFGPGLGSSGAAELHQRFGSRLETTGVGQAMTCVACHKSEKLGTLNWPMDSTLIGSYVKDGEMPFGYDLPKARKAELYAKVIQDYFAVDQGNPGILKSWLLGKRR